MRFSCLFLFFCIVLSGLNGQQAEAAALLEQASRRPFYHHDSVSHEQLRSAYELLREQPPSLLKVEIMSRLSYSDHSTAQEKEDFLAAALDDVEQITGTGTHRAARWAWLRKTAISPSMEQRLTNGKLALNAAGNSDPAFYKAAGYLISIYSETRNVAALEELIGKLETALSDQPAEFTRRYGLALLEANMERAALAGDYRLAAEYGQLYYERLTGLPEYPREKAMLHAYSMSSLYNNAQDLEAATRWGLIGLEQYAEDSLNTDLYFIHYSLGNIADAQGNSAKAIRHFETALDMLTGRDEKLAENISVVSEQLAHLYRSNGNSEQALQVMKTSLAYAPTIKGYYVLAFTLNQEGRLEEALSLLQQGIMLGFEQFNEDDLLANPDPTDKMLDRKVLIPLMLKGRMLTQLSAEQPDRAQWELAEASIRLALQFIQPRENSSPGLRSAELVSYDNYYYNAIGELLNTLEQRYAHQPDEKTLRDFLLATERVKARNFSQLLTTPELPEAVIEESRRLERQRAELQQALALSNDDIEKRSLRNKLLEHTKVADNYGKQISERYAREGRYFYNVEYSDFTDLEAALAPEEAVLTYSFYRRDNKLYINYTDRNGTRIHTIDQPTELADDVERLNQLLRSPLLPQRRKLTEFKELSRKLYDFLIGPFSEELVDKKKLVIIPSLQLQYLPFEALLSSDATEDSPGSLPYLIRTLDVSYAPSATTLLQLRAQRRVNDRSLLAFAPVFNTAAGDQLAAMRADFTQDTTTRAGLTADGFTPLPYSREEVTGIHTLLGRQANQKLLLNENATAAALVANVDRPLQFLHVATHGLAHENNPLLSALACRGATEDELLYANEIQFLPLNVDLAILSSCDSGIGELAKSEGVLALSRTFLYAGANNVISSLWKISDRYSSRLMLAFYRHYLVSGNYAAALRSAKLELLANPKTALPRYWAPFLLVGQ